MNTLVTELIGYVLQKGQMRLTRNRRRRAYSARYLNVEGEYKGRNSWHCFISESHGKPPWVYHVRVSLRPKTLIDRPNQPQRIVLFSKRPRCKIHISIQGLKMYYLVKWRSVLCILLPVILYEVIMNIQLPVLVNERFAIHNTPTYWLPSQFPTI